MWETRTILSLLSALSVLRKGGRSRLTDLALRQLNWQQIDKIKNKKVQSRWFLQQGQPGGSRGRCNNWLVYLFLLSQP
jgi:hypothetical protein